MIIVNGIEVTYDLHEIVSQIEELEYAGFGEHEDYSQTEEEFEKHKADFLSKVKDLTDEEIVRLVKENAIFTKSGKLHKGRRHILLESGIISNYFCEYGSHQYDVPSLTLETTDGMTAILVFDEWLSHQESF